MMRPKKLVVALARKWKMMAGFGRRTISINRKLAKAGHFVVYSSDKRRFVVPLAYLRTKVFQELLRLSEEEFGMPKDGPVTLPCDVLSLLAPKSRLLNAGEELAFLYWTRISIVPQWLLKTRVDHQ